MGVGLKMKQVINLNADLGESFGAWNMGNDAAMLEVVASANIACGFHAGDPLVMQRTVAAAKKRGVSIGAHPAYPDLQGFGRRRMELSSAELAANITYQIGALQATAAREGCTVTHVKPHGAMNNVACVDEAVAKTIVETISALDPQLILLAPALSVLFKVGRRAGLRVVAEIFADRAYLDDGQLVPRSQAGAMIHGADEALAHVRGMLEAQAIVCLSGKRLPAPIESICVHGDGPEAVATAHNLKVGLGDLGYQIVPLPQLPG